MLHALRAIVPSCRSKFCSSELGSPCPAPLNSLRLSSTGQQKHENLSSIFLLIPKTTKIAKGTKTDKTSFVQVETFVYDAVSASFFGPRKTGCASTIKSNQFALYCIRLSLSFLMSQLTDKSLHPHLLILARIPTCPTEKQRTLCVNPTNNKPLFFRWIQTV